MFTGGMWGNKIVFRNCIIQLSDCVGDSLGRRPLGWKSQQSKVLLMQDAKTIPAPGYSALWPPCRWETRFKNSPSRESFINFNNKTHHVTVLKHVQQSVAQCKAGQYPQKCGLLMGNCQYSLCGVEWDPNMYALGEYCCRRGPAVRPNSKGRLLNHLLWLYCLK